MNIVVLSGKGGTGKTTVSINLASIAPAGTALLDCDVEEPNSHLFIKKKIKRDISVTTVYPIIDDEKCTHCGACARFCSFNALLSTRTNHIVMAELCHGCEGCALVCPAGAISFGDREIGKVGSTFYDDGTYFADGILNTGEFSAEKIIERVLEEGMNSAHRIIDAPPGCACSAVKTVEGADLALVVTEPTPFALSDMKMVIEMLESLSIPGAVFINKSTTHMRALTEYCESHRLPILGELPHRLIYGESLASGEILTDSFPEVKDIFVDLWDKLLERSTR